MAGIYDLFVHIVNGRTHKALRGIVSDWIESGDAVLECACGTGMLSAVIAERCGHLTATDFSEGMIGRARKNCRRFDNITFKNADITALPFGDKRFDKVVAGNVIHLLDEPLKALCELNRVCKPGGTLIIPTYMNRNENGRTGGFVSTVGKAGADFKRQFTVESYRRFFQEAGYADVQVTVAEGRIPCAVAVMKSKQAL